MKNLILATLLVVFSTSSQARQCPVLAYEGLTDNQMGVMYKAYQAGKEHDMAYSLAAIAWKESSAGKYMVNLQDPSAGAFHITINNALVYLKWEDTNFNRNRAAQLLIEDFQLAANFAMINLQFWKDQYGSNWTKIWASYNAGYNWKNGVKYSQDIARKIKKIKLCGWWI
jgi:hypothetical protein